MPTVHDRPSGSPSRTRNKNKPENMFGPYVLLYTIGEGEFAKVKYGIHSDSGDESAIKLIRKENIDGEKLSKIKREISVLKSLSHPHIVRLVEVIETQNYIGIVLEYASGGELFDHILAHRYLKEREACRLFSQLICGVDYLHRKKIIHRDLKLENLLLDRNRNIIITDFGFANHFGKNGEDLMATSCGSPCYAAPELVVSDGMYVGSAVDIWSCGVILYAMLAGYLPFDDDPENPDGDNINLLYKYILSTPLSFPDYVGSDARDLLRKMLVPDPTKRCKVKDIISHKWMGQYKGLFEEFKLKAKLEFVTGTPTSNDAEPKIPPEINSKSKRHTIQIDSPVSIKEQSSTHSEPSPPTQAQVAYSPELLSPNASTIKAVKRTSTDTAIILEEEIHQEELPSSKGGFAIDASYNLPLDPFDPHSIAGPSQPINPFDPSSVVYFPSDSAPSRPTQFKLNDKPGNSSKKDKYKEANASATFPFSSKQSKVRPISLQPPTTPTTKRISIKLPPEILPKVNSPSKATNITSPIVSKASNNADSNISAKINHSAEPQPGSSKSKFQTDNNLINQEPVASGRESVDSDGTPRSSNRIDARKTVSAVVDPIQPPPKSSVARQHTLSPSLGRARRITDWIKRKSLVIRGESMPAGFVTPEGIMTGRDSFSTNKENGSPVKLRYHRGAVDQFALTSRSPSEIIVEIKTALITMGFIIEKDYDFKVKMIRPLRGKYHIPRPPSTPSRRFNLVALRDLLQIRPRSGSTTSQTVREPELESEPEHILVPDTLYGDTSIDNGKEVRLAVELCRIKNFPNLYILDIKRMKGNIWSYKFLYHYILEQLQLNANGGYLNPGP